MAQTRAAGSGPIPPAKKDDSEDVAWALSTAEAMYARGDRGDALKWLRRAAESASEAQADDRALELAKAAAELAGVIGPSPSAPPPPASPLAATLPQPAPVVSRPAALPPAPAAPAPAPAVPPPPPAAAPPPPPPAAGMRPKPPARPAPPPAVTPVAPRIVETRRPRRSRPEIQLTRPIDEVTQVTTPPSPPAVARRRRASRPPVEEAGPPPTTRRSDRPTAHAGIPSAAEIDAWPTESRSGELEALAPDPDEKTRIGVPAYDPNAPAPADPASTPVLIEDPSIRSSQAVRVIVWRAADGVHIAPHGTRVAAITVDAVLVALDPAADLTAWLTGK
jgi:hypothetical protein